MILVEGPHLRGMAYLWVILHGSFYLELVVKDHGCDARADLQHFRRTSGQFTYKQKLANASTH